MKFQPLQVRTVLEKAGEKLKAVWAARNEWRGKALRVLPVHAIERYDTVGERVNVILSPAYYWYKSAPVTLKNLRAAKRIAPSVFFSWIPEGTYRYFVFEEGAGYGFIACNEDEVVARLNDQGLKSQYIERIFFAQSALKECPAAVQIGPQSALMQVDGAWVALPLGYAPGAEPFDETPRTLSGPSIKIAKVRESGMDRKRFIAAAVLLLLLMGVQGIDLWRQQKALEQIENERQARLEKARLPQTSFQLESIERRLNAVAEAQSALRIRLGDLLAVNIAPARLESLELEAGKITAEFSAGKDDEEAALAGKLKTRFPKADITASNGRLKMALSW